jgi:hypothetical protein
MAEISQVSFAIQISPHPVILDGKSMMVKSNGRCPYMPS